MFAQVSEGMNFTRLRSWGTRGGLAILDQGAYSGSNFILNILLARWVTQQDYGAFSVAFTIVLFLSSLHNAIQLEPMSVIGPANYQENLEDYLNSQIRLNFIITIPIAILFILVGRILLSLGVVDTYLSQVLVAAGLAMPFLFFLWVVRRTFYVRQQPMGALFSSVLYAVLMMSGLLVVHRLEVESSMTGFGLMGLAGFISGLTTLLVWRKRDIKGRVIISLNRVMSSHWNFGRWALAAAALAVAASQVQILLTAGMVNLEAAGAFSAMQNLVNPMAQIITAIAILGLPALSVDFGRGDLAGLRRKGLFLSFALTVMSVLYLIAIWFLGAPLDQWLYNGKYNAYLWLVLPLGFVPIFTAMGTGFSLMLRSIQKVQFYLIGGIVSGVIAIISSYLMIRAWGIAGSAASLAFTFFISFITTFVLYRKWFPKMA
jgi:O-antigen/teichoic acid export membrane protein